MIFAVNDALEKKLLEGGALKAQLEAELQDKLKKMEKEFENSIVKAAGKHCCKSGNHIFSCCHCLTLNFPISLIMFCCILF